MHDGYHDEFPAACRASALLDREPEVEMTIIRAHYQFLQTLGLQWKEADHRPLRRRGNTHRTRRFDADWRHDHVARPRQRANPPRLLLEARAGQYFDIVAGPAGN